MCITSDRYHIWHTGNRQFLPFTWVVSALDPEYAHHNIFVKMIEIKNGWRCDLVIKKCFSTVDTFCNSFGCHLVYQLLNNLKN